MTATQIPTRLWNAKTLLVCMAFCAFASGAAQAGQDKRASALSKQQARAIVAPLYEALNEPSKKDVPALLAQAAHKDYRSCSTNTDCLSRDQLVQVFIQLGKSVPDLHWTIVDLWTVGDQIVVRGEATGTPTGEFFGAKPTGKSFKTMSIDVFTVRDSKLAKAYHVENWVGALEQIK
jgi:predicted ester cyclase